MKNEILEKLNSLEEELASNPEESAELEKAMSAVKSREEVLALLKTKGIEITEEDLAEMSEDELSEAALEEVAGGIWLPITQKHGGFLSGLWRGGRKAAGKDTNEVRTKENTTILYQMGSYLAGYPIN